ncbi:MAG: LacI family DNA-binding transcriptional regulator [Chitinophagaceae bacterium]
MKQANLKTLAEELNLSISTVSKALRDSYEIGQETKNKVKALAEKLNYQPNPFASSLRKRSSKTIAVIIPEISNNFFALAIDGIQDIAREMGYHVLTYLTHEALNDEISTINHLRNGRVDGVLMSICSETGNNSHLEALSEIDIPIVFFDRVYENLPFRKVTTDDYESGFNATKHLIDANCKRIAFLAASKHLSIINKRMNGYINALEKSSLKSEPELIIDCGNDDSRNYQIIRNLLESTNPPDAIFASVEKLAINAYQACKDLEIRIPQDVKILSFSNLRTASLLAPSLTTITQPAYEIGKEAASILIRMIEKKQLNDLPDRVILKSALIPRESTQCS